MADEKQAVRVKTAVELKKFEGDPEDGKLLETMVIEDGKVVEVRKVD